MHELLKPAQIAKPPCSLSAIINMPDSTLLRGELRQAIPNLYHLRMLVGAHPPTTPNGWLAYRDRERVCQVAAKCIQEPHKN